MSVEKRPGSKFYWYDFWLEGERYRGSTKRTNKREAEKVEEAERRKALDALQFGSKEEITLRAALDRYVKMIRNQKDHQRQAGRAEKLLGRAYDRSLRKYTRRWGFPENKKLSSFTNADLADLVGARQEEGSKPRTINLELALLQRVLNVARKSWRVRVPVDLDFAEYKFRVKNIAKPLTPDEVSALWSALDPKADRPGLAPYGLRHPKVQRRLDEAFDFAFVALHLGGRFEEVAGALWSQVDWDFGKHGGVRLHRGKVENEGIIGFTADVAAVMRRRWEARRGPYIFPSEDGKGHRPYHTTRAIIAAMDRAGINTPEKVARYGRRTLHSLRDTFGTTVGKKLPIQEVQKLLGHATITMTRKYVETDVEEAAKRAVDVLEGAFATAEGST